MGEGLDESLRQRVEILSEKMKQSIHREMVWMLKMAVRWCLGCSKEFMFSRGDVGWD